MPFSYVVRRAAELCPEVRPEQIQNRIAGASFVSLERRYLFAPVAKAGATSIKWLLHEIEGGPPIGYSAGTQREVRRDMFIHARGNLPLPSLIDLDDATQEHVLNSPDFMRFTVVRNPYTRLASAWRDKVYLCAPSFENYTRHIKGRLPSGNDPDSFVSFAEFVAMVEGEDLANCDRHWRLQTVLTLRNTLSFTHVGRLEDFGATIRAFLSHVGLDARAERPPKNRSAGAFCYDSTLAKRVYELYRQDFEAFGYDRDSWAPAATEKARAVPESVFADAVLERNLLLTLVYDDRDRLSSRVRELEQARSRARSLWFAEGGDANGPDPEEFGAALRSETDPFLRAHYTFRLAEGYRRIGALEQALTAYLARTSLGYWDLEVAWSFYRIAELKERMGHPVEEVLDAYARAHAARPDRAEPLHAASRLCRIRGRFAEGYDLARRGLAIALPSRAPFLETWIYDYGLLDELSLCAYYTGRHEESLQACETLLREGKLPEEMRDRVAANAEFARAQLRPGAGT
jgi:tetratricopeptide (TPR) repeat protein